jgi:2-polyprenyl-3-methyl-5-hydroxy-6-metoxy-1,4-benzoquinol methylase
MAVTRLEMEKKAREKIAQKVEQHSQSYYFSEQQTGIDNRTKRLVMKQLLPYIHGPKVLELGFVDGMFTDMMLAQGMELTVLEGAAKHVHYAREKYKNKPVTVIHDYFETFHSPTAYDTIIAGDMIQYLEDPVSFFSKAKSWLTHDGAAIVTTPNRRSFHRRIGGCLGISNNPEAVTDHEKSTGNIKMYDSYELKDVLVKSGLHVHFVRGSFLKPLSSKQIEHWDDELLNAFLDIGNELGDYCWFLTAYCTKE